MIRPTTADDSTAISLADSRRDVPRERNRGVEQGAGRLFRR